MSDSEAAGRLTKIPGIVDAARTIPVQASGVPRLVEKVDRTEPLLDMVELRIISPPIRQRLQKTAFLLFLSPDSISEPTRILIYCFSRLIKAKESVRPRSICGKQLALSRIFHVPWSVSITMNAFETVSRPFAMFFQAFQDVANPQRWSKLVVPGISSFSS